MNLEIGKTYDVEVVRTVQFGCIVKLEDNTTEMIHISKISNQFIDDVSKFVSPGDKYQAVGVEGTKNPVQLSIRHLNIQRKDANKEDKPTQKQHDSHRSDIDRAEFYKKDEEERKNYKKETKFKPDSSEYDKFYQEKQRHKARRERHKNRTEKYFD